MMGKIGGNQMTNAWKILDRVLPEKKKCHGCELAMTTNDLKDGEFLSCCPDGDRAEHQYNQAISDIRQRLLDTYGKEWVVGRIDGETSDGYHTFNELYEHRVLLWINLCLLQHPNICYLVENHFDGWFLLGVQTPVGQLSYHCPNKYLDLCKSIPRVHPEFDGHTSQDVIDRLKNIASNQAESILKGLRGK